MALENIFHVGDGCHVIGLERAGSLWSVCAALHGHMNEQLFDDRPSPQQQQQQQQQRELMTTMMMLWTQENSGDY